MAPFKRFVAFAENGGGRQSKRIYRLVDIFICRRVAVETIFQALADPTRLRVMRLLGSIELAVGEIAQVLGQSQPRVSRHAGILTAAGLIERRREGSWVFLRASSESEGSGVASATMRLLDAAEAADPDFAMQCEQDRERLSAVREAREEEATRYFADHAKDWDELRRLHISDRSVEDALVRSLGDRSLGRLLDIGTGTGRMAELLADRAEHVVALDKSLAMLRVARAKLQHLPADRVELAQADFNDLPFADENFDTVLFHQVLHFAQDPAAVLEEAARVLVRGGRLIIVDFAEHDREDLRDRFAHVRLGFGDTVMADMLQAAGFDLGPIRSLEGGELVVRVWHAERSAPDTSSYRREA